MVTRRRRKRSQISCIVRYCNTRPCWLANSRANIKKDHRRRFSSARNKKWMLQNSTRLRSTTSSTIPKSHSTVTVVVHLSAKWWPVRILTARRNGSILVASKRRISPKSGIVQIARSRERRPETLHPVVTLLTRMARQLDMVWT